MTQPGELDGVMKHNDSKLQSSDSQENSRDDGQSDFSEMVGFASLRSFEVILQTQPSKNVTVQYKERTCKCKSAGAPRNITLWQAHFQLPLLIIISRSLKPLNLLSTKDTSKSI